MTDVLDLAVAGAPGTPRPGVVACAFYRDAQRLHVVAVGSDGKTFVFETSLAEYSDRNNGAASTKDRDERNCPDGIAEQRRSDSHTHGHDEHDCGRNNGNKPVHGAP